MVRKNLFGFALLLAAVPMARGQRTLDYDNVVVPQNRIDARDLGYAPIDLIPDGESAITALTIAPNGNLYGATSGKRSHLFVLSPRHGYVQPLGYLPDTLAVTNALVVSGDTGPLHIATAVGTPTVSVFGPTDPARNGPWSAADVVVSRYDRCGCHYDRRCHEREWCLGGVTVAEVSAAVQHRLGLRGVGG